MDNLPLFPDKAASVAIVMHSLLLGKCLTDDLNPSQTPVGGMDHPTCAVRKQIQWKWNEETTELCTGASRVANLFDMPDTMDEYLMALNTNVQTVAAFEDAADINTTSW